MKQGILTRVLESSEWTAGTFECDGLKDHLYTLERPWKDNQHDISCIPEGEYEVEIFNSPHFGRRVYRLLDVLDRDSIEIHPANKVEELKGCIALGLSMNDQKVLSNSVAALNRIMECFGSDNWKLIIKSI